LAHIHLQRQCSIHAGFSGISGRWAPAAQECDRSAISRVSLWFEDGVRATAFPWLTAQLRCWSNISARGLCTPASPAAVSISFGRHQPVLQLRRPCRHDVSQALARWRYCFVGAGFTVVSHPFLSPRSKPGGRGSSHPFRCSLSHSGGVLPPSQPCLCPGLLQPGGDGSLCGVPGVDDGSAVGPPCGPPPPPLPPPLASALDAYDRKAAANAAATNGALVIALVP